MNSTPKTNTSESFRTIDLRPRHDEMIKPAELIDIVGASSLTLSARRMYNSLLANAFGREMGIEGHEWTIPLMHFPMQDSPERPVVIGR